VKKNTHPWTKWITEIPNEKSSGGQDKRTYNRLINRAKGEIKTLNLVKEHLPCLFENGSCPNYGKDHINKVLDLVYKEFSGYQLRNLHNFFIKGLEEFNNKKNCSIPIPDPITTTHRTPSPFNHQNYHQLHLIKPLVEKFKLSIEDSLFFKINQEKTLNDDIKSNEYLHLWIGQIIFSSIYNGALLNTALIYELVESIKNQSLIVEDEHIWFDFKVTKNSNSNKVLRRWFPDSLTALLILRLFEVVNYPLLQEIISQDNRLYAQKCFKLFLRYLDLKSSEQLSISQFVDISSVNLHLYLPPYLVNFAKNYELSPSLSPKTWIRLRHNRSLKVDLKKPEVAQMKFEDGSAIIKQPLTANKGQRSTSQIPKLIELQRILYSTNKYFKAKTKISKWLRKDPNLSPLLVALAGWCIELITCKQRVRPSSAKTYLSTIGRRLVQEIGNEELTNFSSEDWETIYLEILKNSENTNLKAGLLIRFHSYLVNQFDIMNIELEYSNNRVTRSANVNLLSPHEYQRTFDYIASTAKYGIRLLKIQQLLLIISYRCGLRKKYFFRGFITFLQFK